MNKKQIIVLWIGIAVIVAMGIFPPWLVGHTILSPLDGGYHFIMNPPKVSEIYCYKLNTSRLCVQWFIIAVVTGGLIVTLKDKKKD